MFGIVWHRLLYTAYNPYNFYYHHNCVVTVAKVSALESYLHTEAFLLKFPLIFFLIYVSSRIMLLLDSEIFIHVMLLSHTCLALFVSDYQVCDLY